MLVTNRHVVRGADSARAKLPNGTTYRIAGVIGTSPTADLVALKIDGSTRTTLPLRDSLPKPGERLVVIGSPLGLDQSVSDGIVSAVRDVEGYGTVIQITAPISAGSSGSPVVDMDGRVLGVATFLLVGGQNLNFAIPASRISEMQWSELQSLGTWWSRTATTEEQWQSTFNAHYDIQLDGKTVGTYEVLIESDTLRFKTTYTTDMRWKGNKRTHTGRESIVYVEQLDGTPVGIVYEGAWPWAAADLEYRFERDRLFCIRRQNGREKIEEEANTFSSVLMPIAGDREYVSRLEKQSREFTIPLMAVDATGLNALELQYAAVADEPFEHGGQRYMAKVWRMVLRPQGAGEPVQVLQKIVMHNDRPVSVYQRIDTPIGTMEYVLRRISD